MSELTRRRPGKILVMDDDQMILATARLMLQRLGYDVVLACHGQEAVEIYGHALGGDDPVDVCILDLRVPGGMGALEASQKILERDPDARLVLASGSTTEPPMLQFQDHGFCAVITKPFVMADLGMVVGELVD